MKVKVDDFQLAFHPRGRVILSQPKTHEQVGIETAEGEGQLIISSVQMATGIKGLVTIVGFLSKLTTGN